MPRPTPKPSPGRASPQVGTLATTPPAHRPPLPPAPTSRPPLRATVLDSPQITKCDWSTHAIVEALEKAAEHVGVTLSRDVSEAVQDMYQSAGIGVEKVVKNISEADDAQAHEIVKPAGKTAKNSGETGWARASAWSSKRAHGPTSRRS